MSPVLVGLGVVLVAAIALGLDRVALKAIRPAAKKHKKSVRDLPFFVRPHPFSSHGQRLQGWVAEPDLDSGGAVAVLVHGWGSSHGRMTHIARPLLEAGFPVFLFDVRYHGESAGAPYVTVRHFRDDIMTAVREAGSLFPGRALVLVGHSMGGSAGVLAVAAGARVQGLVTIAAPADLWMVWARYFDGFGLPGRWVVRLLSPFWRVRAGEPFRILDPARQAMEVRRPFLVLHGDRDGSVGVRHAHILSANAGVEPVILEGEGHNELLANASLHNRVTAFLGVLTPSGSKATPDQ